MVYLLFLFGLLLILKGADLLVGSARYFARRLGVHEAVIGVTLVSICTTLPEATVSVTASWMGESAMATANAIGSIAANIGLILGVVFLIARPEIKEKQSIVANCWMLLLSLGFWALNLALFQGVPQASGFVLLAFLVIFLYANSRNAKKHPDKKVEVSTTRSATARQTVLLVLGAIGIFFGSRLLVKEGIAIAQSWGLPSMVMGLTATAVGTSLPELVTAILAIRKNALGLTVGNLIGASILNVLLVIGASAAVHGLSLPPIFMNYHLPALLLMVSGVLLFTLYGDRRYTRLNGGILLFMYLTYLWIGTLTSAM